MGLSLFSIQQLVYIIQMKFNLITLNLNDINIEIQLKFSQFRLQILCAIQNQKENEKTYLKSRLQVWHICLTDAMSS